MIIKDVFSQYTDEEIETILETYSPVIERLAKYFAYKLVTDGSLEKCDLVTIGQIAVLKAVGEYVEDSGRTELGWVRWQTRLRMIEAIREYSPRSRKMQAKWKKYEKEGTKTEKERLEHQELSMIMNRSFSKSSALLATLIGRGGLFGNDPERMVEIYNIKSIIDALPQQQREVLEKIIYEDMRQHEIGQEMGLTQGRVCQILTDATKELKEQMQS